MSPLKLVVCCAALGALALACPKPSTTGDGNTDQPCTTSADCNSKVCIESVCSACQGNSECVADYGADHECRAGLCAGRRRCGCFGGR